MYLKPEMPMKAVWKKIWGHFSSGKIDECSIEQMFRNDLSFILECILIYCMNLSLLLIDFKTNDHIEAERMRGQQVDHEPIENPDENLIIKKNL
jgi:hypothetical protein